MKNGNLKYRGIFVTATDTDVGKTAIAVGLVSFLSRLGFNVGVMKPVASGAVRGNSGQLISTDVTRLVEASLSTDPISWVNPYCFRAAVAPSLAAEMENVQIKMEKILDCFQKISGHHDIIVVEGAGGILTPIFKNLLVVDVIKALQLPTVIVSKAGLGAINHTTMTYECLKSRELECLGFFLNRYPKSPNLPEKTNARIITALTKVPYLGSIPDVGDQFSFKDLSEKFINSVNKKLLCQVLCREDILS